MTAYGAGPTTCVFTVSMKLVQTVAVQVKVACASWIPTGKTAAAAAPMTTKRDFGFNIGFSLPTILALVLRSIQLIQLYRTVESIEGKRHLSPGPLLQVSGCSATYDRSQTLNHLIGSEH